MLDAPPARPLSIVYITLNAMRCLPQSLASLDGLSDDLVVVDAGSSDDTVTTAQRFGARTFHQDWLGFGLQKQFAVEQARHDWVLILDADELLLPQAKTAIRRALGAEAHPSAFRLPRYNYLQGKRIRHGDWGGDRVLRLVDRRRGEFTPDMVHERWVAQGPVAFLDAPLAHYSFENYKAMLAKLDQYSDLTAEKLATQGRRVRAHEPMSHALMAFLKGYVFRLGFLDGTEGAAIALTSALGSFMKYAKALELQAGKEST